jgi:hypothetical protein
MPNMQIRAVTYAIAREKQFSGGSIVEGKRIHRRFRASQTQKALVETALYSRKLRTLAAAELTCIFIYQEADTCFTFCISPNGGGGEWDGLGWGTLARTNEPFTLALIA